MVTRQDCTASPGTAVPDVVLVVPLLLAVSWVHGAPHTAAWHRRPRNAPCRPPHTCNTARPYRSGNAAAAPRRRRPAEVRPRPWSRQPRPRTPPTPARYRPCLRLLIQGRPLNQTRPLNQMQTRPLNLNLNQNRRPRRSTVLPAKLQPRPRRRTTSTRSRRTLGTTAASRRCRAPRPSSPPCATAACRASS